MSEEKCKVVPIPTTLRWNKLLRSPHFITDKAWARIMRQDLSKRRFRRERAKLRARRWNATRCGAQP